MEEIQVIFASGKFAFGSRLSVKVDNIFGTIANKVINLSLLTSPSATL